MPNSRCSLWMSSTTSVWRWGSRLISGSSRSRSFWRSQKCLRQQEALAFAAGQVGERARGECVAADEAEHALDIFAIGFVEARQAQTVTVRGGPPRTPSRSGARRAPGFVFAACSQRRCRAHRPAAPARVWRRCSALRGRGWRGRAWSCLHRSHRARRRIPVPLRLDSRG